MGIKSFLDKMLGKTDAHSPMVDDLGQLPSEEQTGQLAALNEVVGEDEEGGFEDPFAITYGAELFFETALPPLPQAEIMAAVQAFFPTAQLMQSADAQASELSSGNMVMRFPDQKIIFAEGELPAQICIFVADRASGQSVVDEPNYIPSFQQSWQFGDARTRLAGCKHSVLVTDLMTSGLPYQERIGLFQRVLYAVAQVLQPVGIHWHHSKVFVEGQMFLDNAPDSFAYNPLLGALNVRLFRIDEPQGSPDVGVVMDTLGLAALGLPDLQIHCRDLDINLLAGMLFGTGQYIFEKGDVILDGNTVAGWEESQRWVCMHEGSLVQPWRNVLDINPGQPYVAGTRN